MTDKPQYFPVPLAHLTSPIAPAVETPWPRPADEAHPGEPPPPPAEGEEPWGMLDVEDPPERYDVDEVTLLARDPYTLFAHWEVSEPARARAAEGDELVLRIHARPTDAGPASLILDERLTRPLGRGYLPAPYPGALIDAEIGLRRADGGFDPIAKAPRLRVPYANAAEDAPVDWMKVPPPLSRGMRFEPPAPEERGSAADLPGAARQVAPEVVTSGAPSSPTASSPSSSPSSPSRPAGRP